MTLGKRLDHLEESCLTLEWQLGMISFEDAFFALIKKQFGTYIQSQAKNEEKFQRDPMFSYDDIEQEILLYLYKWTLNPARERSLNGKVWLPYVKRSVHNCIVNIRRSSKNWRRRLKMAGADITDNPYLADDNMVAHEGEAEIEYTQYVEQVASMLTKQEQTVYYQLLEPTKKFTKFIQKHSKKNGEVVFTRKLVAKYFDLPYTAVVRMFNKFRTVNEYCSQLT